MLIGFANDDVTKTLVTYWNSLPVKPGELCPYRRDFHIEDIPEVADYVFLDERHSDDVVCVIYSGRKLNKTLGIDFTGHNLIQLFDEEKHAQEKEYFHTLYRTPCAGYLIRSSKNLPGKKLIYRTSHLPLLDNEGMIRFWVGVGTIMDGAIDSAQNHQINLGATRIFEREYFDIGAGLPKNR